MQAHLANIVSLDGNCYTDGSGSDRLLNKLKIDDKTGMTPEVCKKICFEKNNFQFAGVQYEYECFCGNNAPPSSKLLPKSECNLPCSGDPSRKCGGEWKMNIFAKTDDQGKTVKKKEFFPHLQNREFLFCFNIL